MAHCGIRDSERGGVMIVFVVVLTVLAIGLLCGDMIVMARLEYLEKKRAEIEAKTKAQLDKNQALVHIIREAIVPIDKKYGAEDVVPENLPAEEIRKIRDEIRDRYFFIRDNAVKDKTKLLDTLQENIPEAAKILNKERHIIVDEQHKKVMAEEWAKWAKDLEPKITSIQDQTIRELEDAKAKILQKLPEIEATASRLLQDLEGKINKLTELAQTEKDKHKERMDKLEAELTAKDGLKAVIKKAKGVRLFGQTIEHEIVKVHGKVVDTDTLNKIAFIDIGSDKRVVKGMRFLVVKPGPRNTYIPKGVVEVKRLWAERSECEIKVVVDRDEHPIVRDDLLINPLFDTERPLVIAFIGGEKVFSLVRSADEYKRRIMDLGSAPTNVVDARTDFVIVMKDAGAASQTDFSDFKASDSNYRRAVELNVPLITEEDEREIRVRDLLSTDYLGGE
ncbi:MAG: hypothetical protein A2Z34_11490 [Planctomycetes bacterium RBG_16_59_8]|nr:MAG: hypothetical protein A2Z34_11490 [Planctomycetes bacterium RBG_16_59_8]